MALDYLNPRPNFDFASFTPTVAAGQFIRPDGGAAAFTPPELSAFRSPGAALPPAPSGLASFAQPASASPALPTYQAVAPTPQAPPSAAPMAPRTPPAPVSSLPPFQRGISGRDYYRRYGLPSGVTSLDQFRNLWRQNPNAFFASVMQPRQPQPEVGINPRRGPNGEIIFW